MSARPQPARSPRNVELVLLVFSVAIAMAAYAAVGLAHDGALPAGMLGYGGGLGAAVRCSPTWRCAASPRTPTRSCCRRSPSSTASAWR